MEHGKIDAITALLEIPHVYDALYNDHKLLQIICKIYKNNTIRGISTDEPFAILDAHEKYRDAAMAEEIPIEQRNESSMDKNRVQRALTTLNEVVKPVVREKFQKSGENLEGRLINTEAAIRKMLLERMIASFEKNIQNTGATKDEKIKFIQDNLDALCNAEPAAMTQAREYFTSNSNTDEIAWRCYDSGSKSVEWSNLFVTPENDNGIPIFTTAESHTGNLSWTQGTNLIREMAAQYFLYIDQSDAEVRPSMLDDFVFCLAEIRRAHNNSNSDNDPDNPTCFPGTIGRFGWLLTKEEKPKLTKLEIISEYCTNKILNKIQQRMTELAADPHQTRLFIDAIVALNHKNALNIIANKGKASGYEIDIYNVVHNKIRQEFLAPLLSDTALDSMVLELNDKLAQELDSKSYMTPSDRAYAKFLLTSVFEPSVSVEIQPVFIKKLDALNKQDDENTIESTKSSKDELAKIKEGNQKISQVAQHNAQ